MSFGATILDAEGLRLTPEEKALFRDTDPFGFILFARNIDSADQVRALCGDFREAVGRDCPVTIDQEGGRVQRLRAPLAREWLPPLDHARQAGAGAARAMYLRYRLIADELRALGIDSNCAPLADVALPQTHAFLRNRCYASQPEAVAEIARAVAQGLLDGGVLPVAKHLPGHGRATLDTHHELPVVGSDLPELKACDFAPFAALSDLPMGMSAHVVFAAVDDRPATLSPPVIRLIREGIGFDGLLMTDDISMKALSGSPAEIARDAIGAGCDVVLFCNAPLAERAAVAEAAGEMAAAAQARAERALAARQAPAALDIEAAEAELSGLMNGRDYDG
ncbi:beta-N-acetylhexosaminidase [Cribrihabitans marinus]|uniref:beta-N-acetylhexosaminidase n=1 Tax=Cribrihabitans marinus TaxID=1227549 RepID=A0A1H6QSJ0_9RHOB|nr:beta-N-acetylhexosaminidase [Cribrihabitans marinus]GGH19752.1 beta-N-acetylhexosaminidase [Cribrihabitans marinus]SEI46579.1 beta-N-acetylhexosaminidase [Cribrihabitans marinus]